MSIGSLGIASAAGVPLARTKGTDVDRAQTEVGAHERTVYPGEEAEAAGSVGAPDGENHETAERDADGRRPWDQAEEVPETPAIGAVQSKDPSGQSGNFLDLTG
jgi:hypothetical protein